jgi:hypothetical protein
MGDEGEALPHVVNRWLGIVGLVIAPTTLITSLLYYFGFVSTRKNLLSFGIDPSAIGYTTSDYVTNSVGIVFAMTVGFLALFAVLLLVGLFIRRLATAGRGIRMMHWAAWGLIALGAMATVVGVVGVWGGLFGIDVVVFALILGLLGLLVVLLRAGLFIRRLAIAQRGTRMNRTAAWGLIALGAMATVVGIVGVWKRRFAVLPQLTLDQQRAVTPAALGGAALLLAGIWMLRTLAPSDSQRRRAAVGRALVAIVVVVVVAAVFWATNILATKAGEIDGKNAAADLWWRQNTVVLDTTERLSVDEMLIKETPPNSADPAAIKTFRYECFRALAVRGDRWVLVPAKWTDSNGIALILAANSLNHFTVKRIDDPRKTMGRAPNVWKYWPCPELVRTVKGPEEVAGLLLGMGETRDKLGDPDLVAETPYTIAPTGQNTASSFESCVAAADPLTQPPRGDSGFVMLYGLTSKDAPTSFQRRWLQQDVLEFQNPAQAGKFVDKVGHGWLNCGHTQLKLDYVDHVQHRTFGDVSYSPEDGVVLVSSSITDEPSSWCSQALGAKANVVVDVQICGSQPPTQATAILDAVRNKFPLWVEERR